MTLIDLAVAIVFAVIVWVVLEKLAPDVFGDRRVRLAVGALLSLVLLACVAQALGWYVFPWHRVR